MLPTVFGVAAFLTIVFMVAVNHDGPVLDYWMEHEDFIMAISHHVTVIIVTFQLICHIQSAVVFRGGSRFPEVGMSHKHPHPHLPSAPRPTPNPPLHLSSPPLPHPTTP